MKAETTLIDLNHFSDICMLAERHRPLTQKGWHHYFSERPKPDSDLGLYFSSSYEELRGRPKFWSKLISFAVYSAVIESADGLSIPIVGFNDRPPSASLAQNAIFRFVDNPHLVFRMAAMETTRKRMRDHPHDKENCLQSIFFPWVNLNLKLSIWVGGQNTNVLFGIYCENGWLEEKGVLIIREVNVERDHEIDRVEITSDENCGNTIAYKSMPPYKQMPSFKDITYLQTSALSKIFSLRPRRTLISEIYVSGNATSLVDTTKFDLIPITQFPGKRQILKPVKKGRNGPLIANKDTRFA